MFIDVSKILFGVFLVVEYCYMVI